MKKLVVFMMSLVMVLAMFSNVVFATESEANDVLTTTTTAAEKEEANDVISSDDTITTGINEETEKEDELKGYATAVITKAGEAKDETVSSYYGEYVIKVQKVTMKVLNGPHKDKEFTTTYYLSQDYESSFLAKTLKVGSKVYCQVEETTDEETGETVEVGYVVQEIRTTKIFVIMILLAILVVILAKLKGLETIGLVLINTLIVSIGFLVMFVAGIAWYWVLATVVVTIIASNVVILNKFNKTTLVVMLAVFIATAVTCGIQYVIQNSIQVMGYTEYATYLAGATMDVKVDYLDILLVGMIVSSLGVTIDMGLRAVKKGSQGRIFSEAIKEVSKKLPNKINNSFLVWLGGVITILFIFYVYERPMLEILNVESLTLELLRISLIILSPVIVMPIGILLGKEMLHNREIEGPINK